MRPRGSCSKHQRPRIEKWLEEGDGDDGRGEEEVIQDGVVKTTLSRDGVGNHSAVGVTHFGPNVF